MPPDGKYEKLERRSIDKIKRTTCHPLHTENIFCEVLKEFGDCVQVTFADREADSDTASLANHYHCPVLANDFDYSMFNLDEGIYSIGSKTV
uniref:XPG-I domain-containing protein n=1 Tax=Amphimedon queenslandica TaxID=400682 RepID=A0A1X7TG57_AMPQE